MLLGVTTVTLPELSVEEILVLAEKNSLAVMELDEEHVKRGNIAAAEAVYEKTQAKGIQIVAYYSAFDVQHASEWTFSQVLETAETLHTDAVVLSLGTSANGTEEVLMNLTEKVQNLADMASKRNIKICFTYHRDTLLEDYIKTGRFLDAVKRENVRLIWQPNRTSSLIYNIFDLKMLAPYVHHVYVSYKESSEGCTTIMEGKDEWQQYLKVLKGQASGALLFKDCDIEEFNSECLLMREWMSGIFTV
ncbi:MAG: hypothetical protein E7403_00410 [Ruminococcaceae bacterium]|nr:hypothetical protein [Oscillospiraceae bacterium]